MKDEIIHSKILNNFKQFFFIWILNQNKPVGSNNPFRIASNWEFVDEDGITNVVLGTEYLNKPILSRRNYWKKEANLLV
jgi:hypothetical protein